MDRNYIIKITETAPRRSLSARRAWIEIGRIMNVSNGLKRSLSARRAWIEILSEVFVVSAFDVALRKESVDRNTERWPFVFCP